MKAIRFLIDCPGNGPDGRSFNQGSAHLLNDASAWHWVRRDKAEYIEHTPVLPPDPVVIASGAVEDPVRTRAEATIARIDEMLANPPSVLAPLIPEIEDGNVLDSAEESVEESNGADSGVRTEPVIVPAISPANRGRSTVRNGRN